MTAAQFRLTDDSSQSKSGAGGGRAPIYYDYAREGLRNQRDRRSRQGLGGGLGGLGGLVEGPEETRGSQGVTCTSKPPLLAAIPRQPEHYSFQFSGRQNKPTF